ncbi:MAG: YraN family protein [Lachnospiraceae bacterium]|nr:YraN family protein [Lachnospiraceae bacterium]MDE7287257.1 YraN family protein [Lachnospiraceae bacterium]
MNKRETGRRYEDEAAAYLEKNGFIILERNFRCRQGEVDLVGLHENCLVFVEVKYRKNASAGMPEEAVGPAKQLKICQVSDYYRLMHPHREGRQIRYDVIAVCGEQLAWYRNAFSYCRKGRVGTSW